MKNLLKRVVMIGICLICFSAVGFAETVYVTDLVKLPLRTGASTEYKILALVESGQQLEVVEPGDDWSLVRLANGKEGYVLTRYLVSRPTSAVQLEQLQGKYTALRQQVKSLIEENNRFKDENQTFKSSLGSTETALKKLDSYSAVGEAQCRQMMKSQKKIPGSQYTACRTNRKSQHPGQGIERT